MLFFHQCMFFSVSTRLLKKLRTDFDGISLDGWDNWLGGLDYDQNGYMI